MTVTGMLSSVGLSAALGAVDMDAEAYAERYAAHEESRPAIISLSSHLPPHLQVSTRPLATNHSVRLLRQAPTPTRDQNEPSQGEPLSPWSVAAMAASAIFLPSLGGRKKTQSREETIAALFTEYETLERKRLVQRPDARIVTPWDPDVTASERAAWLRHIMSETYWDKGSKVLIQPPSESVRDQENKNLLTWFMLVGGEPVSTLVDGQLVTKWMGGQPVSTASLAISNGNAVMCYAASIPQGGEFPDKTPVQGREKIPGSTVQYGRMKEVLRRPEVIDGLWGFDSYLRLGVKFEAPNRRMIESGIKTQHINGRPLRFLFCQPLYHKDFGRVEFRVVTRLFLEPDAVAWNEPLYTPRVNPYNPKEPTQAEIGELTYDLAGKTAQIIDEVPPGSHKLAPTDLLVFNDTYYTILVKFEGAWTLRALRDRLAYYQMKPEPNVEIVVENKPENITLQKHLLQLGTIALGVKPGGDFTLGNGEKQKVPTLFHFSLARLAESDEERYDPVGIELADEYKGTPMEDMAHRVHTVWRDRLSKTKK